MLKIKFNKIISLYNNISESYFKIYHPFKNFVNKFFRILKNNFNKFFYSTLLLLFIYQFYDITHQYFRYEHSIHLVISKIPIVIPSITHCVNQKHVIKNKHYVLFICDLLLFYKNASKTIIGCEEISKTYYVRYRNNSFCVTFINNLFERDIQMNLESIETYRLNMAVIGFKRSQLIVHGHFAPPHFGTKNVFQMSNKYILRLSINKINIIYLPYPYSTDCLYYGYDKGIENRQKNVSEKDYLTRPGCMLTLIRQKYKEYNCNYSYWDEYVVKQTLEIDWTKSIDPKCDYKINFTQLERKCKIECQHLDYLVTSKKLFYKKDGKATYGWNSQDSVYMMNMTYIPKMDFINYLSTLGGLMTMYASLNVKIIFNIVVDIIKKRISLLKMILIKILTLKLKLFSPKLLIELIFLSLMMQQVYLLIDDFFEANLKVDISLTRQLVIPNFQLWAYHYPDRFLLEFIKKSHSSLFTLCRMNLSKCSELFRLKQKKIDIWLESNNQMKVKSQDPIIEFIGLDGNNYYTLQYTISQKWNLTSIMDNNIQIHIEYINDVTLYKLYLGTIIDDSLSRSVLNNYINIGVNNYLFAEQKILQKIISENGKHCDQSIGNKVDNCYIHCLRKRVNDTYGCLFVTLEEHIILQGDEHYSQYDLCPYNINKSQHHIYQAMRNECIELCPDNCLFVYSNVYKTKIMKNKDKSTKMIYRVTSHVSYIEKYRMDYWELIYQLGGIVGVWFGWSALSVTSIAQHIKPFIKLLK